jgi:hypothetical protein
MSRTRSGASRLVRLTTALAIVAGATPFVRAHAADDERARMVAEQLAARGIADARVLDAMRRVARHVFVHQHLRADA